MGLYMFMYITHIINEQLGNTLEYAYVMPLRSASLQVEKLIVPGSTEVQ